MTLEKNLRLTVLMWFVAVLGCYGQATNTNFFSESVAGHQIQSAGSTAPASLGISIANPVPESNRSSKTDIFFDGSAAIFAVLSVMFAVLFAWFAIKGWSAYHELKTQLRSEVKSELTTTLKEELLRDAVTDLRGKVSTSIQEELTANLTNAKVQLRDELHKMAKEPEWQEDFAKEMKAQVQALILPASSDITSDEFDGPK